MDIQQAKEIVARFNRGEATAGEKIRLNNWYARENLKQMQHPEIEDYHRIRAEIFTALEQFAEQPVCADQHEPAGNKAISISRQHVLYKYLAAAAAVAIITLGVWLYKSQQSVINSKSEMASQHDIGPGGHKAFLTLADGSRVELTNAKDGELAVQAGTKISKTANGVLMYIPLRRPLPGGGGKGFLKIKGYNTIEIPKGGTYQLHLPDGTKVWLNAATRLKYPVSFGSDKERRVTLLSGEAYFEVSKDKKHPFVVQTDKQKVEVLGTYFNISSYEDDGSVKTTLLEGSVKVSLPANKTLKEQSHNFSRAVVLKPREQSIIANHVIDVERVDVTEIIAWKNGMFQFDKATLKTIMQQLQRWYDVDVKYENNLTNVHYTGIVPRNRNISEVLRMLEETGPARFKISGRTVIVMK